MVEQNPTSRKIDYHGFSLVNLLADIEQCICGLRSIVEQGLEVQAGNQLHNTIF